MEVLEMLNSLCNPFCRAENEGEKVMCQLYFKELSITKNDFFLKGSTYCVFQKGKKKQKVHILIT